MSTIREEILNELGVQVTEEFNAKIEIQNRVKFLMDYLLQSGREGYVLGVSGGVDSTVAARLAQLAVNELNGMGVSTKFIAVRLPHSIQKDEDDAQQALTFIKPSEVVTSNIFGGTKEILSSVVESMVVPGTINVDFAKGNVKARVRMTTQYLIANITNTLVVGTDHSAEAVTGFYTLHGDGACDIMPLSKLNKRQVRLLAKELGAPKNLYTKEATADLEDNKEQLSDELALGVTYDEIDNYLEGKPVSKKAALVIERLFDKSRFKRTLPASFKK